MSLFSLIWYSCMICMLIFHDLLDHASCLVLVFLFLDLTEPNAEYCVSPFPEVAESVQQELESYRAQEDEVKRLKSIMVSFITYMCFM